jgi:hypothetical protein
VGQIFEKLYLGLGSPNVEAARRLVDPHRSGFFAFDALKRLARVSNLDPFTPVELTNSWRPLHLSRGHGHPTEVSSGIIFLNPFILFLLFFGG